jgi:signal transduction histidine kinase
MANISARVRARLAPVGDDVGYLLSGFPLWALPAAVMAVPWTIQLRDVFGPPSTVLGITVALFVPLLFVCALLPWLTRWQRRRLLALQDVAIPDADAPRFRFNWPKARAALQSEDTWRQALYHGIVGPAVGFGTFLSIGFALMGVAFLAYALGPDMVSISKGHSLFPFPGGNVLAATLGLGFIASNPRLLGALAAADVGAAKRLLGPSPTVELSRRVEVLSASRAAAVEAADAERRRIERDLHDGAQQQLMSLSVNLGIARKTLRDVPEDAMAVIVEAHEQAKEAMAQLRDFVRGLHPAVLDDRGLDAALSGIAARSAVPVKLTVDVPGPLGAATETVAYFVVSEALANVVKHSQASRVTVDVFGDPQLGRLQVRVADDGVGGADPARGTGLAGLRQRVATVDGTLRLTSPDGGPTVLTVLLPYRGSQREDQVAEDHEPEARETGNHDSEA